VREGVSLESLVRCNCWAALVAFGKEMIPASRDGQGQVNGRAMLCYVILCHVRMIVGLPTKIHCMRLRQRQSDALHRNTITIVARLACTSPCRVQPSFALQQAQDYSHAKVADIVSVLAQTDDTCNVIHAPRGRIIQPVPSRTIACLIWLVLD